MNQNNGRSNLRDCSNAYIVVTGTITAEGDNDFKKRNKKLTFKNHATFRSTIYNLIEYSSNYFETNRKFMVLL